MIKKICAMLLLGALLFGGILSTSESAASLGSNGQNVIFTAASSSSKKVNSETVSSPNELKAYDDVRTIVMIDKGKTYKDISNMDLSKSGNIIPTLWFNENTKWPDKTKMPPNVSPEDLLRKAINPGLGVRELHSRGITGKGVNIAIIDQPMLDDHPEYEGKIVKYNYFCDEDSEPSMHGPGVTSLLVGEKTGTAPGARVYYAATPTWNGDAAYEAKALDWIIEENSKLASNKKIRLVSVSSALSGKGSLFTKNTDMWDKAVKRAKAKGILIVDSSENGFIGSAFFSDLKDVDNMKKCMPGYPGEDYKVTERKLIMVPTSPRTTAEEYIVGNYGYQYTGRGGLSWAVPYCSGVLAMGWQICPELTSNEIVDILFKTAYKNKGAKIINPVKFINYIQQHNKTHK